MTSINGPAWNVKMTSFQLMDNQEFQVDTNIIALVDSGTSDLYLPKTLVQAYYHQVENATNINGTWQLPCSAELPKFQFGLQGGFVGNISHRDLALWSLVKPSDADEYNEYNPYDDEDKVEDENPMCFGRLQETEKDDRAVFGLPVFASHFLVFDLREKRIGFAKSSYDAFPEEYENGTWKDSYSYNSYL